MEKKEEPLIYGNIRLDTSTKLAMFKLTLPLWLKYWDSRAVIRIRGRMTQEGKEFATQFPKVSVETGSQYNEWRHQTFIDLRDTEQRLVFQYLEDHMPHPEAPNSRVLVETLIESNVDILPYSWFDALARARQFIAKRGANQTNGLLVTELSAKEIKSFQDETNRYVVGLASIFEKDFYLNILRKGRPYIRRYDPSGPFDVEQPIGSTWFAPVKLAWPTFEVGVCLDDDHVVPGSSASSRGLVPNLKIKREYSHHKHGCLQVLQVLLGEKKKSKTASRIMALVRNSEVLTYSIRALASRIKDSKMLRDNN